MFFKVWLFILWFVSCVQWLPACVASLLPPDRPPAVVSTVWRWLWTPAELQLAWHCSPLVPPAQPPSVLSWRGCRTQGHVSLPQQKNKVVSAHVFMLDGICVYLKTHDVWSWICSIKLWLWGFIFNKTSHKITVSQTLLFGSSQSDILPSIHLSIHGLWDNGCVFVIFWVSDHSVIHPSMDCESTASSFLVVLCFFRVVLNLFVDVLSLLVVFVCLFIWHYVGEAQGPMMTWALGQLGLCPVGPFSNSCMHASIHQSIFAPALKTDKGCSEHSDWRSALPGQ